MQTLSSDARRLGSEGGLSEDQARALIGRYGANELPRRKPDGLAKRVLRQLFEPISFLLVVAAIVAWFGLNERLDAAAIFAIVTANIVLALVQEGKAARALETLRTLETPRATVRRDGRTRDIPARDLVPGDVVLLAAGDRIPADVRFLVTNALEVNESILTGESLPVRKGELEDGINAGFAGTLVSSGTATAVVTATGRRTKLGSIAQQLEQREPPTPLQRELRLVSMRLGAIAIGIAVIVFGVIVLRLGATRDGLEMAFLTAAALAVAAVPEGLPTVVTVGLTLGVKRMAGRGSIVRRLPAVETLGSTTVILTDKTGTLTENRMRVSDVVIGDAAPITVDTIGGLDRTPIVLGATLCNDATTNPAHGDPLEIALLEAIGRDRVEELRGAWTRVAERPFDSASRSMSVMCTDGVEHVLLVKGAPEVILERCARLLDEESLLPSVAEEILAFATALSEQGGRVIAFAHRNLDGPLSYIGNEEHDLTFVGLVSLRDPVRPEALRAVEEASAAGIRVIMVTGDHPGTARAIAREVGLASPDDQVMLGEEMRINGTPDDPTSIPVYARADPSDKLALVTALQERGHIVAVTGDGVNDAPALHRADIGVAMGQSGSDVARETSDMIVTDDNLDTIVHAVREGRGIYDNIRKVVEYLIAGNLSEILVVIGGLVLFPRLGVPLLPLQLLWINLLTDGFPALALGVDPVDPGLMERSPRPRSDHLLSGRRLIRLLARGVLIAAAALGSLAFARAVFHQPWSHARASMFSVLMTAHLLYAFVVRRPGGPRLRSNPWLIAAVAGGIVAQIVVVSLPFLERVFGTASLSLREWALVLVAGALPVVAMRALARKP